MILAKPGAELAHSASPEIDLSILDKAQRLGADMTRIEFKWKFFHRMNFHYTDDLVVRPAQNANLSILAILHSDLGPAPPRCRPWLMFKPHDMAAWKRFVQTMVERYDGNGINDMPGLRIPIKVWQLGAEYPRIWCSDSMAPGKEFSDFLKQTRTWIQEVDPHATVKMPGLNSFELLALADGLLPEPQTIDNRVFYRRDVPSFLQHVRAERIDRIREFFETPLRERNFDVADIHVYGAYNTIPHQVMWLRSHVGNSIPIWIGEGGGPYPPRGDKNYRPHGNKNPDHVSPELLRASAAYVVKYYLTGLAAGVERLAWNFGGPTYKLWGTNFGDMDLLNNDTTERPSYYAYKNLKSVLGDVTSLERLPDGRGATLYKLTKGGKPLYVLWNDSGAVTVDLATELGSAARAFRLPAFAGEKEVVPVSVKTSAIIADLVPIFVEQQ